MKTNNVMGSYFRPGKGVLQGDPLSPLLFNMAADALPKIIKQTQKNNHLSRLVLEYVEKGVAILQYVDDTILCMEDKLENAVNMKLLLCIY